MRHLTIKFILLIIFTSTSAVNAAGFEFFGTNKHGKYNIEKVSSEISREYKTDFRVTSLVVASKDCGANFKSQLNTVEKLDAEKYGLIFISACVINEDEHGYHTTSKVALRILNNISEKLLIYSPDGVEIYNGEYITNSDSILKLINITRT